MCTIVFLKEILNGTKSLLKLDQIKTIPRIPKYAEIDVKKFWNEIKTDNSFNQYFPSVFMNEKRVPDRTYFFTV